MKLIFMETKNQYMEGKLEGCNGCKCKYSCCDDDQVEEWINEYFAFHDRLKDYILSQGITIEFINELIAT